MIMHCESSTLCLLLEGASDGDNADELAVHCSVQVGWNVVLCRMSTGRPAGRLPEPKKYYEKRLPSAEVEIADRRRSIGQKSKRAPR